MLHLLPITHRNGPTKGSFAAFSLTTCHHDIYYYTIMHYLELFLTPSFTHTTMFNIAIKTKEADSENACLCNQIFIFQ